MLKLIFVTYDEYVKLRTLKKRKKCVIYVVKGDENDER